MESVDHGENSAHGDSLRSVEIMNVHDKVRHKVVDAAPASSYLRLTAPEEWARVRQLVRGSAGPGSGTFVGRCVDHVDTASTPASGLGLGHDLQRNHLGIS